MIKPKPAAIFDHCQHCGVTTVWQYRGDADAGQVRGQLVAAGVAVLRGAHSSSRGMTGYPTIPHASAELPSVAGMVEPVVRTEC